MFKKLGYSEAEILYMEKSGFVYKKKMKQQLLNAYDSPSLESKDISNFEVENRVVLPDQYRTFMLENNGGAPIDKNIVGDFDIVLDMLFAIKCNYEDFEIAHYVGVYKSRIPSDMLPVGASPFGDLFLMGISDENFGKIFYWDHNYEAEDDGSNYYDNIEEVAGSFSDFIAMLHD